MDSLDQLPEYKCHKVVRAGQIAELRPQDDGSVELDLLCAMREGQTGFKVLGVKMSKDWAERFKPEVGAYVVRYDDGYTSISPARAFDEGYTLISFLSGESTEKQA